MSNWKYTLNLVDIWTCYNDPELTMSPQKLSLQVAQRIKKQNFYKKYIEELEPIVEEFEILSEDDTTTIDDFDNVLSILYDWADQSLPTEQCNLQSKLCWVKTI